MSYKPLSVEESLIKKKLENKVYCASKKPVLGPTDLQNQQSDRMRFQ